MENYGNNTKDGSSGSERSGKIYQVLWDKLIEMNNEQYPRRNFTRGGGIIF